MKRKSREMDDVRINGYFVGTFKTSIILGKVRGICPGQRLRCAKENKRTLLGEDEREGLDSISTLIREESCWRDVVVVLENEAEAMCLLRHEYSELWRLPIYCDFIGMQIEVIEQNEIQNSSFEKISQKMEGLSFQDKTEGIENAKALGNTINHFRKVMSKLKQEEEVYVECLVHVRIRPHLFSFPLRIQEQQASKSTALNGFVSLSVNRQLDLLAKDSLYLILDLLQLDKKSNNSLDLLSKIPFIAMMYLRLLERAEDFSKRKAFELYGGISTKSCDLKCLKDESFLLGLVESDVASEKDENQVEKTEEIEDYDDSKEDELIYENQEQDADTVNAEELEEGKLFCRISAPGQMNKSHALKDYQQQGLAWMLFREQRITRATLLKGCNSSQAAMTSSFEEYILPFSNGEEKTSFFFNPITGTACFSLKVEEERNPVQGGILADQMGLGKTIMTISLILQSKFKDYESIIGDTKTVMEQNNLSALNTANRYAQSTQKFYMGALKKPEIAKTLIIVPKSLVRQWEKEIKSSMIQDYYLEIFLYEKSQKYYELKPLFSHKDVIISTYGVLASEFKSIKQKKQETGYLINEKWERVILDEAHIIRNRRTLISQACCALDSKFRWCLTGTPLQNKLDDLFAYFKFLKVPVVSEWNWWNLHISSQIFKEETQQFVRAVLNSVMLRRTKASRNAQGKPILVLPKKQIIIEKIPFKKLEGELYSAYFSNQKELFEGILNNLEKKGDSKQFRERALVMVNSLRMMCNNFQMVKLFAGCTQERIQELLNELKTNQPQNEQTIENDEATNSLLGNNAVENDVTESTLEYEICYQLAKTERVLQIIEELKQIGEKVVLFTQWYDSIHRFEKIFSSRGIEYCVLNGKMSIKERAEQIRQFQCSKQKSVLILSLMAGCVGLNLTCANNVILMDPWWNSSVEEQAIDRIYRIGQKKDIKVYKCLIEHPNSMDLRICELTQKKENLIASVLSASSQRGAAPQQSLSVEDYKFLFGLVPQPEKEKKQQRHQQKEEDYLEKYDDDIETLESFSAPSIPKRMPPKVHY